MLDGKHLESLTAKDLIQFISRVRMNLEQLAPLIDDLNALEGADFDTGSNSLHLFNIIQQRLSQTEAALTSAHAVLAACTTYARTFGRGHIGVFIASLFASLEHNCNGEQLRPIEMRRFLKRMPQTIQHCFRTPEPILLEMAEQIAQVGESEPDPIRHPALMVGTASLITQETLIEKTSGWCNAGAAFLSIFMSTLHSFYEGIELPSAAVRDMLKNITAGAVTGQTKPNPPRHGSEFSVDFHLDCRVEDYQEFCSRLDDLQVRYSQQGTVDLLGMGAWRFHIDTTYPRAVLPRVGWLRHVIVKDARYGELIGHDELAIQQEASGVLYLSRPTWQRPDTVRVVALVRHWQFIEEVATTGAWTVFNPIPEDAPLIASLIDDAPGQVGLILVADEEAAKVAKRAETMLSTETEVIYGNYPYSDAITSVCAAEAAPIFMPQVGDKTKEITRQLLRSSASTGLRRCAVLTETDPESLKEQIDLLIGFGLQRIVFFTDDAHRDLYDQLTRQSRIWYQARDLVEVVESTEPHIVLVNG